MPEPKTDKYWGAKGYQFLSLGNCDACGAPVQIWQKDNRLIPLDCETLETHFSSCPRAREYRTEQRTEAGVL